VKTSDPNGVPVGAAGLGSVIDQERGSLPYALIHGESLVACASWALGDAGVTSVDSGTGWTGVRAAGEAFVLHDVLCPMTPAAFIASCVARATDSGVVVVGVRPVTDTVKRVAHGFVGETVDRTTLRIVTSPIVLPAAVVDSLDRLPSYDFVELVTALADRFEIDYVEAPPEGRRISSEQDLRVLEKVTRP